MNKDNKNPLLSGLLNVLIPGFSQVYINRDWGRFIRALLIGVTGFAVAFVAGNTIQTTRGVSLPAGLCTGGLVMALAAVYFVLGYKVARERNSETDAAAFYDSKRKAPHAGSPTDAAKIGTMGEAGLIPDPEYDAENAKTAAPTK